MLVDFELCGEKESCPKDGSPGAGSFIPVLLFSCTPFSIFVHSVHSLSKWCDEWRVRKNHISCKRKEPAAVHESAKTIFAWEVHAAPPSRRASIEDDGVVPMHWRRRTQPFRPVTPATRVEFLLLHTDKTTLIGTKSSAIDPQNCPNWDSTSTSFAIK